MYFPYFQIFSTKVPLKFEKYMKLLDIFGDIISKCPDIIRKNTPLPAHSLDSSRSIELKLLVNHYETPCSLNQKSLRIWPEDKSLSYQGAFPIENIVISWLVEQHYIYKLIQQYKTKHKKRCEFNITLY